MQSEGHRMAFWTIHTAIRFWIEDRELCFINLHLSNMAILLTTDKISSGYNEWNMVSECLHDDQWLAMTEITFLVKTTLEEMEKNILN